MSATTINSTTGSSACYFNQREVTSTGLAASDSRSGGTYGSTFGTFSVLSGSSGSGNADQQHQQQQQPLVVEADEESDYLSDDEGEGEAEDVIDDLKSRDDERYSSSASSSRSSSNNRKSRSDGSSRESVISDRNRDVVEHDRHHRERGTDEDVSAYHFLRDHFDRDD